MSWLWCLEMHELDLFACCAGADDVDVLGDDEGDDLDLDGDLGPETQIITTGCWLTMKESVLVIGEIATYAPGNSEL